MKKMNVTIFNSLTPIVKKTKRVGRGQGSGLGKTCGRGHKGQKSRTGHSVMASFRRSQDGYMTKFPKRGFKARDKNVFTVKVSDINSLIEKHDIQTFSESVLKQYKLISVKKNHFISIVCDFDIKINKAIKIIANKVSKGAEKIITDSGCGLDLQKFEAFNSTV